MNNKLFLYTSNGKNYVYETETGLIYLAEQYDFKQYNNQKNGKSLVRKTFDISEDMWKDGKVLQNLWLITTHSCNMNCSYCYEKENDLENKFMSKETAKKSIDYFLKYLNKDTRNIKVNFFGGEPLLNKEVFLFATEYINDKLSKSKYNISYILTTNGTILDDEILDVIVKNNMHIKISIDGNKETHNGNRKFKNNKGTFDVIAGNIKKILKVHNNVVGRITLNKRYINSFKDDVLFLWKLGLPSIYFLPVDTTDESLRLDKQALTVFQKQLIDLIQIMNDKTNNKNKFTLANIIDYESRIENNRLMNECQFYNSFTIMFSPEGDLYNCTRVVGNKQFCAGNLDSKLIWNKFKREFKPMNKCHDCWAKRLCGGGCPVTKMDEVDCLYNKIVIENSLKSYTFIKTSS
ncbi:radical SAM protein [Clostridiaceae bacterium M8S5]|nr:radical SAM protein [Clostridiaceae bacterium M8S5]